MPAVPAFINNFNHLTWTAALAQTLELHSEIDPIIVDNASNYEPLLDWYTACPYEVIRLPSNLGARAVWEANLIEESRFDEYIVTDSDLDLSKVPLDMLTVLREGLSRDEGITKCGLSLQIDDLPLGESHAADIVYGIEVEYWQKRLDETYFDAPIDTTLALYRTDRSTENFLQALRTAPPYCARHLPWYVVPSTLSEEFKFFLNSCSNASSFSEILRNSTLQEAL